MRYARILEGLLQEERFTLQNAHFTDIVRRYNVARNRHESVKTLYCKYLIHHPCTEDDWGHARSH